MGNALNPFKENPLSFAYEPLINPPILVEAENESLRVFSFKELKKVTKKFKQDRVVKCEDRSVRKFYNGYINETTFPLSRTKSGIAVSVVECLYNRPRALQEWKEKVKKSQGDISHPNLVKILGYCCEDNEALFFVFKYFHKGSLDRLIFGKEEVLPWETRVKIAIGTAQALAFIHSVKNSLLYLELRMHNIMLDEQYNAKLLYLEPNHKHLEEGNYLLVGFEYFGPEYALAGHWGTETDVYTFGVILLELFSGLKAFDKERIESKRHLLFWTRHLFSNNYKIGEIIDPRLGNDYPVNAATQMCTLIKRCIDQDIRKRPLMQQVLDDLNDICRN